MTVQQNETFSDIPYSQWEKSKTPMHFATFCKSNLEIEVFYEIILLNFLYYKLNCFEPRDGDEIWNYVYQITIENSPFFNIKLKFHNFNQISNRLIIVNF